MPKAEQAEAQAKAEAKRCVQCKEPKCIEGCPIGINIPAFINLILKDKRREALLLIKERNIHEF